VLNWLLPGGELELTVDYARFGYRKPDLSTFESDPRAMLRDLPARVLARAVVAKQHRDWVS
jgi:hypothetical protein